MVRLAHFKDVSEDPQAWANGYFEHVTYATGRTDVMPTSPIEMASIGPIKTKIAPEIGHDTDAILASLGYTAEQIAEMRAAGAIK